MVGQNKQCLVHFTEAFYDYGTAFHGILNIGALKQFIYQNQPFVPIAYFLDSLFNSPPMFSS